MNFSTLEECIRNIENADISLSDTIYFFNEIIGSDNFFYTFKINELLTKSSLEELSALRDKAIILGADHLIVLVNAEIQKKQSPRVVQEFSYFEKVVINVAPIDDLSCSDEKKFSKQFANHLNPERFHFNYPDLALVYRDFCLQKTEQGLWNPVNITHVLLRKRSRNVALLLNNPSSREKEPYEMLWHYMIKLDMFLKYSPRLWNQTYAESPLNPYYNEGRVFLQNYYRIFSFDALSGELLWSFSPQNKFGREERIVSMKYIDSPEPAYQIAFSDNVLYTELNNFLIALNIAKEMPEVIWRVPLGQYTLASIPYIVDGNLFAALINTRGELWGILLDRSSGKILWTSFVGISTKICPASNLIVHDDYSLYFVSNRGIAVSFDILTGYPAWIFEYTMTLYNITDIFRDGRRKEFIKVPFGSSIITVFGNGLLFKPRDSMYAYFCDKQSGKTMWKNLLQEGSILLTSFDSNLFMLTDKKNIISVDMNSGGHAKIATINQGEFRGLIRVPSGMCLFKVGSLIYSLFPQHNELILVRDSFDPDSWLKGEGKEAAFFECKNQELFCFGQKTVIDKERPGLNKLKNEKHCYNDLINSETGANNMALYKFPLQNYMRRDIISIDKYTRLTLLKNYYNKRYFDCLGNSMGLYNDIYLRVGNFLEALSFESRKLKFGRRKERAKKISVSMIEHEKNKIFTLAEGEMLRSLEIRNDTSDFPYFLILKNDQLLCVKKMNGEIVWSKFILGVSINEVNRKIFNKNLCAGVYSNTLVIFDGINLFGVDADSGELVWVFSLESDNIDDILHVYVNAVESWDNNFLCDIIFCDEHIIHFRKGRLYFIEPATGYCYSKLSGGDFFIAGMQIEKDVLLCFYLPNGKIELYDYRKGIKLQDFKINSAIPNEIASIDAGNKEYEALNILKKHMFSFCIKFPYCYFQLGTGLWCFDFNGNRISHKDNEFRIQDNWRVDKFGDSIFSYSPFYKIISWEDKLEKIRYVKDISTQSYEQTVADVFGGSPQAYPDGFLTGVGWDNSLKASQYLHFINGRIIYFTKEEEKYYIVAINIHTGEKLWKVFITSVYAHVYHIARSLVIDGKICFTLTTKPVSPSRSDLTYLYTIMLVLDTENAKVVMRRSFPLTISLERYMNYFSKVNDTALINENNEHLIGIRMA